MWKIIYIVFFVGFLLGAALAGFMFFYGLFHDRFDWKALVMLGASILAGIGMWRRFRFPPKDPIFERQ
jgi:hypothetical protein